MEPESSDPLLGTVILALAIASVGTWFALADRLKHGQILKYEPRRPVPWHGAWTLLPILFVVLVVVGAVWRAVSAYRAVANGAKPAEATDTVEQMVFGSLQEVAFVVAFLTIVAVVSNATRLDLGLPMDRRELLRDVRIGVIAWLASLAPVYGVQILLINIFGPTEGHPLVKMLEEQSNPMLFAMAFVVAVVVAPVCEELMFRVLLQGWLEKWEDEQLRWRNRPRTILFEPVGEGAGTPIAALEVDDQEPPRLSLGGWPYGWLPIAASSLLFALAHFGYGPEPVPLFFLALILGYVYQRTHRIVPSMVTHALFNGMSLFALWRLMSAGAP